MAGIVTETDVVRKVIAARLPASSSAGAVTNGSLVQIDIIRTVFMVVRREIAQSPGQRSREVEQHPT